VTHEVRTLTAPGMAASFAPELAMVCCSLVHGGHELLGLRGGLDAYAARGATMGVPLLHPWANRLARPLPASALVHPDPNGLPIHGVLPAALPFTVEDETASSIRASFSTSDHPAVLQVFHHPHRLRVEATLTDDSLEIRTTLAAMGRRPVPVAFGYHPYLSLPGVPREEWEIEAPVRTALVLDDRMLPTGERNAAAPITGPLGARTFDDAYADVADGTAFSVGGGGRTITVTFLDGYPCAQIYAPADADVICFEPMTAPTNALATGDSLHAVRPGDAYSAAFRITVA
jgi:galactose mutarotase-like enzyme